MQTRPQQASATAYEKIHCKGGHSYDRCHTIIERNLFYSFCEGRSFIVNPTIDAARNMSESRHSSVTPELLDVQVHAHKNSALPLSQQKLNFAASVPPSELLGR